MDHTHGTSDTALTCGHALSNLRKNGSCKHCNHKALNPHYRRDYARQLRERAILSLGGKCVACGTTDMRVLEIDHIHGGGRRHHKTYDAYYRSIALGTYDGPELQLLCGNDHNIKTWEFRNAG